MLQAVQNVPGKGLVRMGLEGLGPCWDPEQGGNSGELRREPLLSWTARIQTQQVRRVRVQEIPPCSVEGWAAILVGLRAITPIGGATIHHNIS